MTRRFRGFVKSKNRWIFGWYIETKDGSAIISDISSWVDGSEWCIEDFDFVERESVGQCADLRDQNGKEIYPHDIVEYKVEIGGDIKIERGEVIFDEGGYCVDKYYISNWLISLINNEKLMDFRVIGDTYTTPELLD